MFIREQNGVIFFDMRHYDIKQMDNFLIISSKIIKDSLTIVIGEFKIQEHAAIILKEINHILPYAIKEQLNLVYYIPTIEQMSLSMEEVDKQQKEDLIFD